MNGACMFTGRRPKYLAWGYKVNESSMSTDELVEYCSCVKAIDKAIEYVYDQGVRVFYTGMALGIDQLAAIRVDRFMATHEDVSLVGYIPCYDYEGKWPVASQQRYLNILTTCCNEWFFVTDKEYTYTDVLNKRNHAMVEDCEFCIAIMDTTQKKGGTFNAVTYAKNLNKKILVYGLNDHKLRRV